MQLFAIAQFRVPSNSMSPTIKAEQRVFVNKLAYGARIFNFYDTIHCGDIFRIKGYDKPRRNDIIVFNNPHSKQPGKITFDVMSYMVKRCIGIPGDTIEISNCLYTIRGCNEDLGNVKSQRLLASMVRDSVLTRINGIKKEAFPYSTDIDWTISDFGPLYIPRKGDTLSLSGDNRVLYRQLVEWESGSEYAEDQHIVEQNYYFVAGDNCLISYDSRYWGLVPEEFIVGRVDWIL